MHVARQTFRFLSLVLGGLALGPAFAHVLEMPAKMTLNPSDYIIVQQIYGAFGVVGALVEPGAIVSAIVLAFLARGQRAFGPAVVASLCLVASLLIWVAVVNPVNAQWRAASPTMVPPDFNSLRMRWEFGHAARAGLLFAGFVSLVVAVIADMASAAAAAVKLTVPDVTRKNADIARSDKPAA